ncbi:Uncharacterized protein OS=Blastopirellula marina DSM 3645 GN=DSM3645_13505 PE=4 SV=1 [Gemmataceae bacterium]|nr:Uncharacterized protein OS=Blastopirellula marina DSM 3645 GN=DSM3645_13505 PE=4 SV=1 [Gemmataceae bacterium]VTU01893.1 Uncharacterized protein OS=Blastopirellula marina DSM 3645 GN=DSM3645_13505 PE=4 SV=1 [Gemmataceae bacterium]
MRVARLTVPLALALVTAGCGGKTVPPRETAYPVSGVVRVKGAPAFEARLTAVPVGAPPDTDRQFETLTNEKGEYRFGSNITPDGLPPGQYGVRITWPDVVRPTDPEHEIDRLRGRYNDPKKPAFTIEVKETTNTIPPFDLK